MEAVASGVAIAARLREAGLPAAGAADVVHLVAAGDPPACRQVRLAAERIGEVLASVVSSVLGCRAGIEGARRLAVRHLLSPEGLSRMLS